MATRKESGQVFTPHYLACDILDVAGYRGTTILHKHIIDNSCGDGAFLQEIVARYCVAFLQQSSDLLLLCQDLSTFIHGVELDPIAYAACIHNVTTIAAQYGVNGVAWDIRNADALSITDYDNRMDYVVGNPPYVRVHNLADNYQNVKHFRFTQGGMTDLYLAFFEVGFNMLCHGGKLCYITPSSWINSMAGCALRNYILQEHNLVKLIDLEHYQAFDAMTYTMISLFEKGEPHEEFIYCTYIGEQHIVTAKECLRIEETIIRDVLYLADRQTLSMLRDIFLQPHEQVVQVKNGFATLADKVFIQSAFPFLEYTIPVLKASTGKWYRAFYPYDTNGKPLSKQELFAIPIVRTYLEHHKADLLKGRTEENCPDWYLYGRTQALKDVWVNKYAINTLLLDSHSIKLENVPKGAGLYSGLYILTDVEEQTLRDVLYSDDFLQYIRTLRHNKSGGYYTFSSKELEQYMNYKLGNHENKSSRQFSISFE